ncbi:MAG: serine/threonine protein kinase, partial [Microcoleaceae cyanobacterium]
GEPEHPESPRSSTRLVSPGYSPPEQIVGARVNPATDFYALGRTCIHLLTGVFPGDLEETTTAELVWRDRVTVSPRFAHLLDQMVRFENALRPQTALEIQTILFHIVRQNRYPRRHMSVLELSWDVIKTGLIQLDYGLTALSGWTGRLSLSLLKATLETIWEMGLGGIGGVIGATSGLMLIYFTPLDESIAQAVTEQFSGWTFRSSEGFVSQLGSGILVSGLAGLGTAVGLTDAGGFNQDRRYGFAAVLGTLGYGIGSVTAKLALIVGENSGFPEFSRLGNLSLGLAAALVTLGLDFPSHQAVYVFITAVGVAGIFWGLGLDSSFPEVALRFPMVSSPLEWETFWLSLAFTGILGSAIGLCLGVSHYLIVPILRWLGWRY